MGTMVMFALQSIRPEMGLKVKPFIALAPVVFVEGIKSSLRQLSSAEVVLRLLLLFLITSKDFYNNIYIRINCNNNF